MVLDKQTSNNSTTNPTDFYPTKHFFSRDISKGVVMRDHLLHEPVVVYLPVDGREELDGERWSLNLNEPLITFFLHFLLQRPKQKKKFECYKTQRVSHILTNFTRLKTVKPTQAYNREYTIS